MFGKNFVLDVESGALHLVDDLTYEMLSHIKAKDFEDEKTAINRLCLKLKQTEKEEILQRFNELKFLFEQKILFSEQNLEDYKKIVEQSYIKAICLHVAHDCNLRCKYCFAATGDFNLGRKLMPYNISKLAIDFLIEKSGNRRNLEVDFFGGEPLLNFDVVKQTVEYAKKIEKEKNKNFRFTITTNGVLLDEEKINFINENMVNVVLSLDGRKMVNDKMRITENKKGSYDLILPKFKQLVSSRKNKDYFVRGTFTRHNLDFAEDFKEIYNQGFDNISIEPVVCEKEKEYAIQEEDLPKIFKEYEKLVEYIIKERKTNKKLNFFHYNLDFSQGPCIIKRLRGCGCGCEYLAISPEGDIYPCHQFVGEEKWKMGNLIEKQFNEKLKEDFSKINLLNKKECLNCWAKYYCSGGCNANNFKYAKDMLRPYDLSCKMERKRVEAAIALKFFEKQI